MIFPFHSQYNFDSAPTGPSGKWRRGSKEMDRIQAKVKRERRKTNRSARRSRQINRRKARG